jgi:hypothetical protein
MESSKIEDFVRKEPLVVTTGGQLDMLNGLIHDEFFELKDVSFSREGGMITIPYRRVFHGHPGRQIRNWVLWKTYEVDVIRSLLAISNVVDYSVEDSSRLGTYSFCGVSYDDAVVVVDCCQALEMRIIVTGLRIETCDLEVRGKTRINRGFLWYSGPGKIYD